jgi:4-hydroxy-4-methyl-2-oxoglutarate aldolase
VWLVSVRDSKPRNRASSGKASGRVVRELSSTFNKGPVFAVELEWAEKLGKYATPTLFEVSPQVGALGVCIAPLYRPIHLWGRAYPLLVRTGDNSVIHHAVSRAPSGSVIVVATGRDAERGYWGEILMEAALARGIQGLVIDGGVRDTRIMRERGFPVFCGATSIPGTTKGGSGVLNESVMITQVLVRPGDFVVGDDDGVVIIPSEVAVEVVEAAEARVQKEAQIIEKIKEGELTVDLFDLRKRA